MELPALQDGPAIRMKKGKMPKTELRNHSGWATKRLLGIPSGRDSDVLFVLQMFCDLENSRVRWMAWKLCIEFMAHCMSSEGPDGEYRIGASGAVLHINRQTPGQSAPELGPPSAAKFQKRIQDSEKQDLYFDSNYQVRVASIYAIFPCIVLMNVLKFGYI